MSGHYGFNELAIGCVFKLKIGTFNSPVPAVYLPFKGKMNFCVPGKSFQIIKNHNNSFGFKQVFFQTSQYLFHPCSFKEATAFSLITKYANYFIPLTFGIISTSYFLRVQTMTFLDLPL